MARASVWGAGGSAFAYRSMPVEDQADLMCAFLASRMTEVEEITRIAGACLGAGNGAGAGKRPEVEATQKGKTGASLPDILKPNLSAAQLAGKG